MKQIISRALLALNFLAILANVILFFVFIKEQFAGLFLYAFVASTIVLLPTLHFAMSADE